MPLVPILVLAAGASSRMRGRDKLLEDVGGQPLLRDRLNTALCCGQPVFVTLPAAEKAPDRWAAVPGGDVTPVAVEMAQDGMAASLVAGLSALPHTAQGVVILLADMPDITANDLRAVLAAFDGQTAVRGLGTSGKPGHPVVLPSHRFKALMALTGDQGARGMLAAADDVVMVPLPGNHAETDLDTPEDWARWRERQHSPARR